MQRDTAASHLYLCQKMLLQTILFGNYSIPEAPVTRSNRIMKQVTYVHKEITRGRQTSSINKDDKLLKVFSHEWKPANFLAGKAGITLNAFYQRVTKFRDQNLIETKRVASKGSVRYRYYRLRQR